MNEGLGALGTLSRSPVWLERNSSFCICFCNIGSDHKSDHKSSATTLPTKEPATFQRLLYSQITSRMLIWFFLNVK